MRANTLKNSGLRVAMLLALTTATGCAGMAPCPEGSEMRGSVCFAIGTDSGPPSMDDASVPIDDAGPSEMDAFVLADAGPPEMFDSGPTEMPDGGPPEMPDSGTPPPLPD